MPFSSEPITVAAPAQTLGSWVRILLESWMSVCVYSVFVLSCMQVADFRRTNPPSKECYRLFIGIRNRKSGQGPKRAVDE
jgi:hypothetical protein